MKSFQKKSEEIRPKKLFQRTETDGGTFCEASLSRQPTGKEGTAGRTRRAFGAEALSKTQLGLDTMSIILAFWQYASHL